MIKGYLSKTLYLSARWLKKAKNFVQDQFIFFTCISDRESHNQLPAQVYTLIYIGLSRPLHFSAREPENDRNM